MNEWRKIYIMTKKEEIMVSEEEKRAQDRKRFIENHLWDAIESLELARDVMGTDSIPGAQSISLAGLCKQLLRVLDALETREGMKHCASINLIIEISKEIFKNKEL